MELPRNVTQIGESNPNCKIYAEDYVISYIKQLNRSAADREIAVALYGTQKEEGGITYLFFYGAARLNFLKRECRHLSQAQMQEIEKIRRRYFSGYDFLGYRLLDGEMVEGFHVCQQGVCRYIAGYAQFYEKNDSMLNFMLEERQEEAQPEAVDQTKYQEVKRRQEERRAQAQDQQTPRSIYRTREAGERGSKAAGSGYRNMQWAAAAAFLLLGVIGVATINGNGGIEDLQTAARKVMENIQTQQLPDAVEVSNGSAQVGTVVAEDKLTDAIQKENEAAASADSDGGEGLSDSRNPGQGEGISDSSGSSEGQGDPDSSDSGKETQGEEARPGDGEEQVPEQSGEAGMNSQEVIGQESAQTPGQEGAEEGDAAVTSESQGEAQPVSYTIQKGDTLIGICLGRYGSDARVSEVCAFNGIEDPDDIKVGQKILLP